MKKGELQLSLEVIVQIVLLALVAFAFIAFYVDVKENDLFEKSYAARDIALLLETGQSVPGDVEIYYMQPYFDVSAYDYAFNDHLVQIFDPSNPAYRLYYPFFLDQALYETFDAYSFEEPAAFVISKVNNQLAVKEHGTIAWEEDIDLGCSQLASTKTEKLSLVVITEVSGFEDVQEYFTDPQNLKVDFYNKATTKDIITDDTNVVLVLAAGSGNTIAVDVPDDQQSEKIGCLIAQEIVDNIDDTDVTGIRMSTDAALNRNTNGLAVRLIIGDHISDTDDLITAIHQGMEAYYNE